jgi:hypothetical protein
VVPASLFAGAVGVFFGFYPARKASLLNPIDAPRDDWPAGPHPRSGSRIATYGPRTPRESSPPASGDPSAAAAALAGKRTN